jgi:RNA polymerase sigma factor (sigma-70 family)
MRTEDGKIIQECLSGKPQAFGMLVDKYREGVYAFSYAELRDFQDAQDVTQEVFLQAYQKLRSLRNRESFAFWLYRIAYRYCVQCLRDRARRVDRDFIEDQDPRVVDAPSLDSHRESQLDESVREALDMLPDAYREVLLLHYFGGLTIKDIARAVGSSPAAIGMRLSRARAQLKEEMMAMMDTAFEGHRLPMGFTFRIVEVVRRIKINPMPRMTTLPWGLSVAAGIIITVMSLNPHMSITENIAIPTASPLPVDAKAHKAGEIHVDILKAPQIVSISSKIGKGKGGNPKNDDAFFMAPQVEGGEWKLKAEIPTPRWGLSTCSVNGKIYTIGGSPDNNTAVATVEEYDPVSNKWTQKADVPTGRWYLCTSVANGKIYAIGGRSSGGALATIEEYDPILDKWEKKRDMPTARWLPSACSVNGKVYVIGGCDGDVFHPAVEEYDPVIDKWTKKADIPTPRGAFGASAVNGKIYAIGGTNDKMVFSTVEEYDPVLDKWTKKSDMPTARITYTCVANNKIYAVGGANINLVAFSTLEEYDPANDTWTKKPDLLTPRFLTSPGSANGKIYAIGGAKFWPSALSTVEEYTPEDWQPEAVSPQGKVPTKWGEVKSD